MSTIISDNSKVYKGFNTVCDAVKATLGAEGKLGLLENPDAVNGMPSVTKDGVSVARHITSDDRVETMGIKLAKESAVKTLVDVGDNTTTTLVLAQAFLNSIDPNEFNKKVEYGFNLAHEQTQKLLKKLKKRPTDAMIRSIATVATNNNKVLGDIVFQAYKEASKFRGKVTYYTNSKSSDISLKIVDGMDIKKGWEVPQAISDQNSAQYSTKMNSLPTYVVPYVGWMSFKSEPLKKFISKNYKTHNIVIVVERMSDHDGWGTFINNINVTAATGQCGYMNIIEAPRSDEHQREQVLRDVALYTGGKVFVQDKSETVVPGLAGSVVSTANNTIITSVGGSSEEVSNEILKIEDTLKSLTFQDDPYDLQKEFLEYRKALLGGKTVSIEIGGTTDSEIKEVADRIDDAVKAVHSAQDGWIVGGGATLAHIYSKLDNSFNNKDIQKGYDAFKNSILAPFRQICLNARRDNADEYLKHSFETYGLGYNATKDEVSDLKKDGIIDSYKGVSCALKNAKSTAIQMLNIGVVSIFSSISGHVE